jgi:hypothetical protein
MLPILKEREPWREKEKRIDFYDSEYIDSKHQIQINIKGR